MRACHHGQVSMSLGGVNVATLRMTYYPDITQKQTEDAVRRAVVVFAEALGAKLTELAGTEVSVEVPPVMSVTQQYRDILAGGSALALMKPVAYVFAHARDERIVPACVAHRPIGSKVGTFYFGQIYARRDTGLRTLDDLAKAGAGKFRIAYGDRFSTSNFLVPAALLRKAGIHPFLHFLGIAFTGGHDLAAEAVYRGDFDVGAGHDGVIKILADTHPDAEEKLIQLGHENIHSDPVVVHTGVLPEGVNLAMVQEACAVVAKTPVVQSALDLFWGWVKDLSATSHGEYKSIEDALELLNLREQDMLS